MLCQCWDSVEDGKSTINLHPSHVNHYFLFVLQCYNYILNKCPAVQHRHSPKVVSMSAQRRRRWASIETTLVQHRVTGVCWLTGGISRYPNKRDQNRFLIRLTSRSNHCYWECVFKKLDLQIFGYKLNKYD